MDPDSCSMTPPLSPSVQDSPHFMGLHHWPDFDTDDFLLNADPLDGPVCFACEGEADATLTANTHASGPLRSGAIERLLREPAGLHPEPPPSVVELYGFQFGYTAGLLDNLDTLFALTRNEIQKLEFQNNGTFFPQWNGVSATDLFTVRQNVRSFFDYIVDFIDRPLSQSTFTRFIPSLLAQFKQLAVFLGRLRDLPATVVASAASKLGNQTRSSRFHLFHLHLEVHWAMLEVTHAMSTKWPEHLHSLELCAYPGGVDGGGGDANRQLTQLLLSDVITLAVQRHNKVALGDYMTASPFPCTCVRELVIMLIHLLNYRQQRLARQSFWLSVTPLLEGLVDPGGEDPDTGQTESINSDRFKMPPDFKSKKSIGTCWWFLHHVAPLFKYDHVGVPSKAKDPVPHCYTFLQALLKQSLASPEVELRVYLKCCLKLADLWETNSRLLASLWDFFYRRLNDHFQVPGAGLVGLSCVMKTSAALYEKCHQIVQCDFSSLDHDNSYCLFLRILVAMIGKSGLKGLANNEWRHMKARIFSKFHARKMQDLTELGLQNVNMLVLILADLVELEDVGGKMIEMYDHLTSSSYDLDLLRKMAVWKGCLAMMTLFVDRGVDISFLAVKLVGSFNAVARQVALPGVEPSRYTNMWRLLTVYLEGVQDIFDTSSQLTHHEHKLIGEGIKVLLEHSRDNELRLLLGFLQSVLLRLRVVYQSVIQHSAQRAQQQRKDLSDNLWQFGFGFVKQHATTMTPPPQLADLAASFTMLAMDSPASLHLGSRDSDFLGCFKYFAVGDQVNASVSCRFLCHTIATPAVMDRLRDKCPQTWEALLVQGWFRCHWFVPWRWDTLQEVTRLVLPLTPIHLHLRPSTDLDHLGDPTVLDWLRGLGQDYSQLQTLKDKVEFREVASSCFGDVSKHLTLAMKTLSSNEITKNIYCLGGHIVKHCAKFTYIQTQVHCLLPVLLDRLAVPRMLLTPNKPIPPPTLNAIREHLYLFIEGLGALDYKRDPYIQRKLKEMVTQYLTRFPPVGQGHGTEACAVHPFVSTLSSVTHPYRQHLLDLICLENLAIRGSSLPPNAATVLLLVSEVFKKTLDSAEIARDSRVLITPCLQILLANENASVKGKVNQLLRHLLEACRRNALTVTRGELKGSFRSFIASNIMVFQGRVFKSLETMAAAYPDLGTDLIPTLTQGLKDSEHKRGVGVDKQLRVAYCGFLTLLGERGKEEKVKLLHESS